MDGRRRCGVPTVMAAMALRRPTLGREAVALVPCQPGGCRVARMMVLRGCLRGRTKAKAERREECDESSNGTVSHALDGTDRL
jgi:hypothetical protein